MNSSIHNFAILLIINSLINDIFSNEFANVLKIKDLNYKKPKEYLYNIFINQTIQLSPDNTLMAMHTNGTLYLIEDNDFPNVYYSLIMGFDVNFLRDSCGILETSSCGSWEAQNEESTYKPFVIIFDCSNVLKYVITNKGGLPAQHTVKLDLGFLLQSNNKLLVHSSEPEYNYKKDIKENTFYGECNMKYSVIKNISSKDEDYLIHKSYDTKTCTVMNDNFREENDLLKNICKSENKLNWTMNSEVEISENSTLPKNSKWSLTASFEPLKESSSKINVILEYQLSQILFPDSFGNSTIIPQFNYTDTIKVSERSYGGVNETIITSNPEGKLRDLKRMYESLSCEIRLLHIAATMTERAYKCIEESYKTT